MVWWFITVWFSWNFLQCTSVLGNGLTISWRVWLKDLKKEKDGGIFISTLKNYVYLTYITRCILLHNERGSGENLLTHQPTWWVMVYSLKWSHKLQNNGCSALVCIVEGKSTNPLQCENNPCVLDITTFKSSKRVTPRNIFDWRNYLRFLNSLIATLFKNLEYY